MLREAQGFGKMAVTDVARHLIQLFFWTESVKKATGITSGLCNELGQEVHNAAVLGSGVMGGGIAQLFAEKDFPVRMKDIHGEALSVGVQSATKIFQKQLKRKHLTQRQFWQKLNRISPMIDYTAFHSVDFVVEAIVENQVIKEKLFRELEAQIKPECIVVSNTSALSISEMQKVFQRPERFAGMHFFNPVHRMPLVEVIRGEKTSDETVVAVFQLAKKLGKTPIVVKDSPGFLVNRLLTPYLNEAGYLLSQGVGIPKIDAVFLQFGMPMGPMELIDEIGLDVGGKVAQRMFEALGERMLPPSFHEKMLHAGRLGKKVGKGFYRYQGSSHVKIFNPDVYEVLGVKAKNEMIADEEILERGILLMINEACRCLDEKSVSSPEEVDLGMIMGMGFPPFRGGLLRYADHLGSRTLVDRLRKYESRLGARFAPSPGLLSRAEQDQKFFSYEFKA
jgi:3-hydroxyacyl-CoA dehydrogenase/enoyl-CoA hydratase/3-hydroxybutyryl-CoA epimerase